MAKNVNQWGERALIRRLTKNLARHRDVLVGVGDDAAVARWSKQYDLLLTSDAVIEGRHFLPSDKPERIGHKAIARVLSDIAAMGGTPQHLVINLVAPKKMRMDRLEKIYRGAATTARRYGASIVGGDTTQGNTLELHVFGTGFVPRGKAVVRSGARAGDVLYVTGTLGGSRLGKHLTFEPRLAQGQWLAEKGWVAAMIDVSDGLATDLRHVLESSRVGAIVDAEKIPLSREARGSVKKALCDGEDFELLFSVPARKRKAFEAAWEKNFKLRCTVIGFVTKRGGLFLKDKGTIRKLRAEGFEHFTA